MAEEYITREAPDIEARKLGLIDAAKALTEKGYTLPDYVLAGLTQDQKDAIALQQQGIGGFKPFLTQAQQAGTAGLGTTQQAISQLSQLGGAPTQTQLDAYMNPFQQSVIDATMSELNKQGQLAQSQLATQAQQAGAFGGSRFGVAQGELGEGLQDARARALAQLNLQNYGQAQAGVQNQLERERALALGIAGLGGQQAQLGQGMASLGAQQQEEDIKRQNLLQGIMQPYQQLGFYGDILQGAPTTQQTLNVSQAAPISPLQSAIGTGIGAISGIAGLRRLGVV